MTTISEIRVPITRPLCSLLLNSQHRQLNDVARNLWHRGPVPGGDPAGLLLGPGRSVRQPRGTGLRGRVRLRRRVRALRRGRRVRATSGVVEPVRIEPISVGVRDLLALASRLAAEHHPSAHVPQQIGNQLVEVRAPASTPIGPYVPFPDRHLRQCRRLYRCPRCDAAVHAPCA